ncbi:MAG: RNA 2',3'-cyclic phosphodiesterase [Planctomycetota bacterium]|jgi:2'-5' RNA ligase
MARTFFALDVPSTIRENLAQLASSVAGAKPVEPDDMHITLRFVGEQDESFIDLVSQVLGKTRVAAFGLRLSGSGRFPESPRRQARVVWAGVDAVSGLLALHHQIDSAVEQLGVPEDEWPFTPHVTLARVKRVNSTAVREFLEQTDVYTSEEWTASSYHLLQSTLRQEGPRYEVLKTYDLQS